MKFTLSGPNASVVAVPETSTWAMGLLALGVTAFLIRRKRPTNQFAVGPEVAPLR